MAGWAASGAVWDCDCGRAGAFGAAPRAALWRESCRRLQFAAASAGVADSGVHAADGIGVRRAGIQRGGERIHLPDADHAVDQSRVAAEIGVLMGVTTALGSLI